MSTAFGIDIGGSGIKGALVDLETGEFIGERHRIETPQPATPEAVGGVCKALLDYFNVPDSMPVGITFPAPLPGGVIPFIANLDKSWEGVNLREAMEKYTGHKVTVCNDADAAGYAEVIYGAAKGENGVVIVTTLGTGIGTALVCNGMLVPNTELGHLELDGHDAETRASAKIRTRDDLSWKEWTSRLQRYYSHLEMLFSPDLIVVGGGVSRKHEKFLPKLELRTRIIPAKLRNTAGIVGAAYLAAKAE